jgi:hypothetical protein
MNVSLLSCGVFSGPLVAGVPTGTILLSSYLPPVMKPNLEAGGPTALGTTNHPSLPSAMEQRCGDS